MNQRMAGNDRSLNVPVSRDTEGSEWQDWLEDDSPDQKPVLPSIKNMMPAKISWLMRCRV